MLSRRAFLGSFAASLAGAERRPNFVVITCDDMGYADIEPYRAEIGYTPHLARMAREGLHVGDPAKARVKRIPSRANRSMLGVRMAVLP